MNPYMQVISIMGKTLEVRGGEERDGGRSGVVEEIERGERGGLQTLYFYSHCT